MRGLKFDGEPWFVGKDGRIAHAVRGLKYRPAPAVRRRSSRIAHAVRGLKYGNWRAS